MPKQQIKDYSGGINTRLNKHRIAENEAQNAVDVDLSGAKLKPTKATDTSNPPGNDPANLADYKFKGSWVDDQDAQKFEEYGDLLIKSYDAQTPKFTKSGSLGSDKNLGVPSAPDSAPTASLVTSAVSSSEDALAYHTVDTDSLNPDLDLPSNFLTSIDSSSTWTTGSHEVSDQATKAGLRTAFKAGSYYYFFSTSGTAVLYKKDDSNTTTNVTVTNANGNDTVWAHNDNYLVSLNSAGTSMSIVNLNSGSASAPSVQNINLTSASVFAGSDYSNIVGNDNVSHLSQVYKGTSSTDQSDTVSDPYFNRSRNIDYDENILLSNPNVSTSLALTNSTAYVSKTYAGNKVEALRAREPVNGSSSSSDPFYTERLNWNLAGTKNIEHDNTGYNNSDHILWGLGGAIGKVYVFGGWVPITYSDVTHNFDDSSGDHGLNNTDFEGNVKVTRHARVRENTGVGWFVQVGNASGPNVSTATSPMFSSYIASANDGSLTSGTNKIYFKNKVHYPYALARKNPNYSGTSSDWSRQYRVNNAVTSYDSGFAVWVVETTTDVNFTLAWLGDHAFCYELDNSRNTDFKSFPYDYSQIVVKEEAGTNNSNSITIGNNTYDYSPSSTKVGGTGVVGSNNTHLSTAGGWGNSSKVTNSSITHKRTETNPTGLEEGFVDKTFFQKGDPVRFFGGDHLITNSTSSPYPHVMSNAKYSREDNEYVFFGNNGQEQNLLADWGFEFDITNGKSSWLLSSNVNIKYRSIGSGQYAWDTVTTMIPLVGSSLNQIEDAYLSGSTLADTFDEKTSNSHSSHTFTVNSGTTASNLKLDTALVALGGTYESGEGTGSNPQVTNVVLTRGSMAPGQSVTTNYSNNEGSTVHLVRNFFHNSQFISIQNANGEGLDVSFSDTGDIGLNFDPQYAKNFTSSSSTTYERPWFEVRPWRASVIDRVTLSNGSVTSLEYPTAIPKDSNQSGIGYTRLYPRESLEFDKTSNIHASTVVAKKVELPAPYETRFSETRQGQTRNLRRVEIVSFADSSNTVSNLESANFIVSPHDNTNNVIGDAWINHQGADTIHGEPVEYKANPVLNKNHRIYVGSNIFHYDNTAGTITSYNISSTSNNGSTSIASFQNAELKNDHLILSGAHTPGYTILPFNSISGKIVASDHGLTPFTGSTATGSNTFQVMNAFFNNSNALKHVVFMTASDKASVYDVDNNVTSMFKIPTKRGILALNLDTTNNYIFALVETATPTSTTTSHKDFKKIRYFFQTDINSKSIRSKGTTTDVAVIQKVITDSSNASKRHLLLDVATDYNFRLNANKELEIAVIGNNFSNDNLTVTANGVQSTTVVLTGSVTSASLGANENVDSTKIGQIQIDDEVTNNSNSTVAYIDKKSTSQVFLNTSTTFPASTLTFTKYVQKNVIWVKSTYESSFVVPNPIPTYAQDYNIDEAVTFATHSNATTKHVVLSKGVSGTDSSGVSWTQIRFEKNVTSVADQNTVSQGSTLDSESYSIGGSNMHNSQGPNLPFVYKYALLRNIAFSGDPVEIEGPTSPESNSIDLSAGESIRLTGLVSRGDSEITKYRVYRKGGDFASYGWLADIDVTSVSVGSTPPNYDDLNRNLRSTSLTPLEDVNPVPFESGAKYLNNITNVSGIFVGSYGGTQLRFSEFGNPHSWPVKGFFDLSGTVNAIYEYQGEGIVFTDNETYRVRGNSFDAMSVVKLPDQQGLPTANKNSVISVSNALFWISNDGVCMYSGGKISVISQGKFDVFPAIVNPKGASKDNVLFFFGSSGQGVVCDLRRGQPVFSRTTVTAGNRAFYVQDEDRLYIKDSNTSGGAFAESATDQSVSYTSRAYDLTDANEYKVFKRSQITYKGSGTITYTFDESSTETVTLTNSANEIAKFFEFSVARIAKQVEYTVTGQIEIIEMSLDVEALASYDTEIRFESIDVTYKDDPTIEVQIDGNVVSMSHTLINTTNVRTMRLYFPSATQGYLPHYRNSGITGDIISVKFNTSEL